MAKKVHASGTLIENEDGDILVLHREIKWPEGGRWGLVGGGIGEGEDIKEAARKKIKAEIGIDFDTEKMSNIQTFHWSRTDMDITFEVLKIPVIEKELDIKLDRVGSSEYRWMTPEEAYKRKDLMEGMYPILESVYRIKEGDKTIEEPVSLK